MKQITLYILIVFSIILYICVKQQNQIIILRNNQSMLLDSNTHFKVNDSLNAIKVANLLVSLKQYKKYHSDDALLIKQLKGEKAQTIVKPKIRTEYKIETQIKDSIIYKDTLKNFSFNDKWYDINGQLNKDSVILTIKSYDELLIVESLQKKKFLFFKLPISIFGYKRKVVNVISKNPNSTIISSEYISIK